MKSKIKRMFCIAFAFAASFMLTVTAYSEVLAANDVVNSKFLGKYTNEYIPGYIWAQDGHLALFAYEDDDYLCFITGTVSSYQLKNGQSGFYAYFPSVARVQLNGDMAVGATTIYNYYATGDVTNSLFNVKIASDQSSLVYVK